MNIGNLKVNDAGTFVGRIVTVGINLMVALRAVESNNDRAPRFEVFGRDSAQAPWSQVGALWEQTSNTTGEAFLQGQIDYPSMPKPLAILLFTQDDGSYNVAWTRPKDRSSIGRNGAPQTAGDGLGESTSGAQAGFDPETTAKGTGRKAKANAFTDGNGDAQDGLNV